MSVRFLGEYQSVYAAATNKNVAKITCISEWLGKAVQRM